MTAMSDNEIISELKFCNLKIDPFIEARLTPAGYDFAVELPVEIPPQKHRLVSTTENITLGHQILATIHLKSSLAREGLVGSFAIIDPGFNGNLTLSLFNASDKVISLKRNEPIVHITFYRTGTPANNPYKGKYQNSRGVERSKRFNNLK